LLGNKKYKYEEFFIDEYKELDDFMVYIENKIFSIYAKLIYIYNIENMNKVVQYNKIKTVIINGRKKCIYMKPRGTREFVKYNKEFILLNRYIKLISKKLKKQKGGTQINYSRLSAHANNKDSFDLLKDSITRIDWDALSTNTDPRAVELLFSNPAMINLDLFNKKQTEANKKKLEKLLSYLHLLEGRASTDLDFIKLHRLIPDINWEALSTNSHPRAVEILFSNLDKVNVELFMAFQKDSDRNLMKQEIDRK
jgi:hypothetical protein